MTTTFWQRTLKIFRDTPVRVEYRCGALGRRIEVIGEIEAVSETSCTLTKPDGSLLVVPFYDLLVVEPAVDKL